MPYIKKEKRDFFLPIINEIEHCFVCKEDIKQGDLNYLITYLCNKYINIKGINYKYLNDVMGVLESAKQEFYRRKVAPYEDRKIQENGDVY